MNTDILHRTCRKILIACCLLISGYLPAQAATNCATTEILAADCQALLLLWNNTGGSKWTNAANNNWNSNTVSPCLWQGVTCATLDTQKRVVSLDLPNNNLVGAMPFLSLTALRQLDLSNNKLSGAIPYFEVPALEWLDLKNNQLSDSIPYLIAPKLKYIDLSNNQLTGSVPYLEVPNLQTMILNNNQLTGNVPYLETPLLESFILNNNKLTGTIPYLAMPALKKLALGNNQLSGKIPSVELPNLQTLELNDNLLIGELSDFATYPALQNLILDNNQLSGAIPDFTALPALRTLTLSNNQLTGTVPDFSKLLSLEVLHLDSNQLLNAIPSFKNLPHLKELLLNNNLFSGDTPSLEALSKLQTLNRFKLDENCIMPTHNAVIQFLDTKTPTWKSTQLTKQSCPIPAHINRFISFCRIASAPNNAVTGFIISGTGMKKVLLRATSLEAPQIIFDLQMFLYQIDLATGAAIKVASNDDWQYGSSGKEITELSADLIPANHLDAALIIELPPGVYSIEAEPLLNGGGQQNGIGLISVDDLGEERISTSQLQNISTRCTVGNSGLEFAAIGFEVAGQDTLNPLQRGTQSNLETPLFDANLVLYQLLNGQLQMIDINDNWQDHPNAVNIQRLIPDYAPLKPTDPAIFNTLGAGIYVLSLFAQHPTTVPAHLSIDLLQ